MRQGTSKKKKEVRQGEKKEGGRKWEPSKKVIQVLNNKKLSNFDLYHF